MSWASKLAKPYRVADGKKFRLKDFDPADTGKLHSKENAKHLLEKGIVAMAELQDKLYAANQWGLLLIFQAMDAAGKDGADQARHVGRQPGGLPGVFVQDSFLRRTGSRLPMANLAAFARARPHRHLQPVLL